jgi:hypothetical protein
METRQEHLERGIQGHRSIIMRTLNRPMFRIGGSAGTGITSGLVPRKRYQQGGAGMSNAAQGLIDFGLNLASATPSGGIFSTAAEAAKGPFANYQKRQAAQGERDFIREKFEEEKKQFRQQLEQDRYLGELAAKGKDEFKLEQLNNYWDPLIEAETNLEKKEKLKKDKAEEIHNVVGLGFDVSDQYKILSNAQAYEAAADLAQGEVMATINPATGSNWQRADKGFAEKVLTLTNKYLKFTSEFLREENKADGGRIGYQNAGPVMPGQPMQASMPMNQEAGLGDQEETNQINISYEQLRERLPQEISDEIVRLLSESYEAFADFAEIQTQADVNEFNTKYNVQLFLPRQSGA